MCSVYTTPRSHPIFTQSRVRLADLPPFERAVVVVKYFEGMHGWKNYPYVGYGHQLQRGEHFTADMTERQADSLLRADLWKCFEYFKGYGKHPKSRLIRKIEAGDRNLFWSVICFLDCFCKGIRKIMLTLQWKHEIKRIMGKDNPLPLNIKQKQ